MYRKYLILIACCLLLLAGCGGSEKSGEAKDKPWDLFTQKEAETVLGFEVKPEIQKIDAAGQRIVYYGSVSEKEKDFIQVSIVRDEKIDSSLKQKGYSVKQLFEDAKSTLPDISSVEGFGDEAFWSSGSTDSLHILTGSVYITISTSHGDGSATLDRAKAIAEKVIKRL